MSPLVHDPQDTFTCCIRQQPGIPAYPLERWRCPTCGRGWIGANNGHGWQWYPSSILSRWLLRRRLRKEGR